MGNSLLVVILVVSVFIACVVSVYFYATNMPSNDNILNNKLKTMRMKNDLDSAIVFDSMYNEGH